MNLQPKRLHERKYAAAIKRLLKGLTAVILEQDSPFAVSAAINSYARSPTLIEQAGAIARAMVTQLLHDGAKTWRQAAFKGSRARKQNLLSDVAGNSLRCAHHH